MTKAQEIIDLCEQGGDQSGTGGGTGGGGTAGEPGSMTGAGVPGSGKAAVPSGRLGFGHGHGHSGLPRYKVGFHYDIIKRKCVKDKDIEDFSL